jgi:hypothetical protein
MSSVRRTSVQVTKVTGLVLTAASVVFATFINTAAADESRESFDRCREDTWRVAVAKRGGRPKQARVPRYKQRSLLVCDEQFFADLQRQVRVQTRVN